MSAQSGKGMRIAEATLEVLEPTPDPLESFGGAYEVLDEGRSEVLVPFLTCGAPNVDGIVVSAKRSSSKGIGGEFSFKISGNGVGATGKVTVTTTDQLKCGSGQVKTAYVHVPVFWQTRSPQDNPDYSWMHVEVDRKSGRSPAVVSVRDGAPDARVVDSALVKNQTSGEPFQTEKGYDLDGSASFTVGFKNDLLDVSLTVTAEMNETVTLSAVLPGPADYRVSWLKGPSGVRVDRL